VRRVVIVGNSGSGKTTLADQVAERLGVPHVELDAHYHQGGWTPRPVQEFADAVREALAAADATAAGWVVCGNYRPVRTQIWARADTIVWLDLPRPIVMWRVTSRSFVRVVRRTELWNGNREVVGNLLALHDPERSLVRWAWDGVEGYRRMYVPEMASATWADLRWYRLRSPGAVATWLESVRPTGHPQAGDGALDRRPYPRSAACAIVDITPQGGERHGPVDRTGGG
jgi:adenylate kinase family enzyme